MNRRTTRSARTRLLPLGNARVSADKDASRRINPRSGETRETRREIDEGRADAETVEIIRVNGVALLVTRNHGLP